MQLKTIDDVCNEKRSEAFERLMNYPRVELPADFDYKKELAEAIDERYHDKK